jgi:hypothetical protein
MPRYSLDRTTYYRRYYEAKKQIYKDRYVEQKEARIRNEELYKPYGGEKNYYKNSLIQSGFLKSY